MMEQLAEQPPPQPIQVPKVLVGLDVVNDLCHWVHWAREQITAGRVKEGCDPAIVNGMVENLAELERILQITAETSPLVYSRVASRSTLAVVVAEAAMPARTPGEVGS